MRTAIFCLLLSLFVFVGFGQAVSRSLDLSRQSPVKFYQNTNIRVSNTFETDLYNLTVTKSSLSAEILSVSEFTSGESFELAFSKVGVYEICFSKQRNENRTCLQLDVLKKIST
jgi:hypothetical protein